jgi:hypothetical protein
MKSTIPPIDRKPIDQPVRRELNELDPMLDKTAADKKTIDGPEPSPNRDPISGAPGAHPVGVGVGAATGGAAAAAAGAAIGSVVPGVGTAIGAVTGAMVGAVAGAVGGGYAGKAVAEQVYPTEVDAYWESEYLNRPYYRADRGYTYDLDYRDAYRFGYLASYRHSTVDFDAIEPTLADEWMQEHGTSRLEWSLARDAVRDAWIRAREGERFRDD